MLKPAIQKGWLEDRCDGEFVEISWDTALSYVAEELNRVRKLASERYAEMGLSDAKLETIFGWVPSSKMAAHYRRETDRKQMANQAAEEIANIVSPHLLTNSPHSKKTG